MSDEKARLGSSIGMFDIIKGIFMFFVVADHTKGVFVVGENVQMSFLVALVGIIYIIISSVTIPVLFVISGFGFRITDPRKCWKKQAKYLLKPYYLTGVCTVLLMVCLHYIKFHYLPGAVSEALKQAGGFLLAESATVTYFGTTFYCTGSVWYIFSLFCAWMLLMCLCKWLGNKVQWGVVCSVLLGWILCLLMPDMPFSIPQSLIAVGFLYAGYIMKKEKLLTRELLWYHWIILCMISLIICLGGGDNYGSNIWGLGLIDIICCMVLSFVFIRALLVLNRYQNKFLELLGAIGRRSLWIICVHAVEMLAIPWYLLEETIANPYLAFIVIYVLHIVLIIIGVALIEVPKRIMIKRKREARVRKQV